VVACAIALLGFTGCGTASRSTRVDAQLLAPPAPAPVEREAQPAQITDAAISAGDRVEGADDSPAVSRSFEETVAALEEPAAAVPEPEPDIAVEKVYDPWEPFNQKTFTFNRNLDRYVLKPVAKGYDKVMPGTLQTMIGNAFDNIKVVPRVLNNLLQGKLAAAGTETGRFLINSTLGIAGLFDIAKQEFGIEKTPADFGQTLGKWGSGPGPYLVLPALPPLTARDAIGYAIDGMMNPLSWVLPLIWDRFGMQAGSAVNDRSVHLDLYEGFEESVVDMYSAVRHGYLQRRENLIKGTPRPAPAATAGR
jgi:phospholipid-binding lipoprotein MlaA